MLILRTSSRDIPCWNLFTYLILFALTNTKGYAIDAVAKPKKSNKSDFAALTFISVYSWDTGPLIGGGPLGTLTPQSERTSD